MKGGAWQTSLEDLNQWIQVDFGFSRLITGVVTQGRPAWEVDRWVKAYKVIIVRLKTNTSDFFAIVKKWNVLSL